jgi:putative endopeptidase
MDSGQLGNRMPIASVRPVAATLLAVAFAVAPACRKAPPPLQAGIDMAGMDKSVAPGDDFNAYANGGWVKATPIPADKASYGIFAVLADETRARTRTLIQDASKATPAGNADFRKIGDYYASFMDEAAIESKGIAPLQPQLDAIAAIADRHALARALGGRLRADVDALNSTNFATENLFGVWVTQGLADPSRSYPYLLQGGLGMPDRDYYVSSAPHMAELRKQYHAHITAMFQLAGIADPGGRATRVFGLETKMAGVHATRVESEDVHGAVSWKRGELDAKAPGLDWAALLDAAGLKDAPVFIVWHPKAVSGLSALTAKESLDAWKDWLTFHAIEQSATFLPKAFVDERFNFRGKALSGIPELRPRWQRGADLTSAALGEAVGKVYAERYFPAATKAKVQAMVSDIVKAFAKRIDALVWMSPETKAKAKRKLETLKVGVGYPDRWLDYSGLEIVKGDALGNAQRAQLFEYRRQLAKLQQPVDRGEWWMTPQTVNAVNLPLQNALNFPAAIIQPPYFDVQADAAHNYGSMGAIIGHEISHSFDDQGSQFDADGLMSNWWTKDDLEHFKAAGRGLAAQFDTYRPFPDLAVNGSQTLGENIADVAGLLAAYDAYRLSLEGRPDAEKDGLSGAQRFFVSYAQSWRAKVRDAELRRDIATDGHAPDQYRALTVRNVDAWYDAFSVSSGQKLYLAPPQRVPVW